VARPDVVEIQDYFPAMAVPPEQADRIRLREVTAAIQNCPTPSARPCSW
jgi:hypothetical protein